MHYRINNLIKEMTKNTDSFQEYIDDNPSYILNAYFEEHKNNDFNLSRMHFLLKKQDKIQKLIFDEAKNICHFNQKVIGIKGCFLENRYYKKRDEKRFYDDIDVVISSTNAYEFYLYLISNDYKIIKDKHLFYNNKFIFKLLKSKYMKMVHCVDLEKEFYIDKKKYVLYVDLHRDLNVGLDTHLNMTDLLNNSNKDQEENIDNENIGEYEFSSIDYVSYLIIHMIKHLPYVNYYNTELSIDIQKIYDIFLIIEEHNIRLYDLEEYFNDINSLHYYVFFLKLYVDIFIQSDVNFSELIKKCKLKWRNILEKIVEMPVYKIMLGDYSNNIPIINKAYTICKRFSNQNIKVIIWKYHLRKIFS